MLKQVSLDRGKPRAMLDLEMWCGLMDGPACEPTRQTLGRRITTSQHDEGGSEQEREERNKVYLLLLEIAIKSRNKYVSMHLRIYKKSWGERERERGLLVIIAGTAVSTSTCLGSFSPLSLFSSFGKPE